MTFMFKRDELRYIVAFRYVSNNKKMNKYLLQLKLPPVYHFSIRRWTRPSTITNTYTRTTTTTWFWIIWYQVHMIYLITTLTVLFYYRNIRRWNWRWEVNHSHHSAKNHIKISKNYLRGYRNPLRQLFRYQLFDYYLLLSSLQVRNCINEFTENA